RRARLYRRRDHAALDAAAHRPRARHAAAQEGRAAAAQARQSAGVRARPSPVSKAEGLSFRTRARARDPESSFHPHGEEGAKAPVSNHETRAILRDAITSAMRSLLRMRAERSVIPDIRVSG